MATNKETGMYIAAIVSRTFYGDRWEENVGILPATVTTEEEAKAYAKEHREGLLAACPRYLKAVEEEDIDPEEEMTYIFVQKIPQINF